MFLSEILFEKIALLKADSAPLWGKMNGQQMVEHLIMPFKLADNTLGLELMLPPDKAERRYQYTIVEKKPFPRELRVPIVSEEPPVCEFSTMEAAIGHLRDAVNSFYQYHRENPDAKVVHPIMGVLSFQEWEYFLETHCQHHLSQFGLWEERT